METVVLTLESKSENESFARVAAASFMARMNPTVEETEDVKTAVSEAVTNAIVHAYPDGTGEIQMKLMIEEDELRIWITDYGRGIADIKKAMEPLYSTSPKGERSGMGFCFMEAFMNELEVESTPGKGTTVKMMRKIGGEEIEE